ncbi:GNAT family N-acetyltransferase [Idiomarina sp.]|uniref:GNAT family N-acetyltransferase n=1 Tax=Idiomarina sp. TaxID=1874361 RepID=UPI0025B86FE0|nr:GNAT family N-acetyltransferase [Idiomarina sp.]MCJ8316218.1 GNAT family N-acetyltransferase [Idiomarina sp.]
MKQTYRELCDEEPSIPLFSQAWWLDAVAGESWDVVLVIKNEKIIGALPYVQNKKYGFSVSTQPKLTQTLGPWIRHTKKSYPKGLAYEKDVLGQLAARLPSFDYFSQNWHCSLTNWLPFYWKGFEQTTRYTYRINIKSDKEELLKSFQQNIRGDIRKAKDKLGIKIREGTLEEFWQLNVMTFKRQQRTPPYTKELLERIDGAASDRNVRDCLVAVDNEGQLHAGAYIVKSGNTAYYLLGGGNPKLRNSGATSLVLFEAMCRQPDEVEIFDFEGSMIEPIERFFRGFGAIQTPYYNVSKTRSKLLKTARYLKGLVR